MTGSGDIDVVQRLIKEGLFPVCKVLREVGLHVAAATAIRWCRQGVGGHRLESVKIGGKWQTTVPAVQRFLAATAIPRTNRRNNRSRTSEAAERYLEDLGLGRKKTD